MRDVAHALRRFFAVPTDAHAIIALDGVRALAASLVFLVHYQAAFGYLLGDYPPLFRAGEYAAGFGFHGVSIFFVLSGFLIYGSLIARPVTPVRYVRRRVRRIYPTFLVVLGIYLLLSMLVPGRSKLPSGIAALPFIAANALLLPGVFAIRAIVTVSWSLSFEICFYAMILLIVVALQLRRWPARLRVVLWTSLGLAWIAGGAAAQEVVRSFILFVPGILLAEAARSNRVRVAIARVPISVLGSLFLVVLACQPVLATDSAGGHRWTALVTPGVLATVLLAIATALFLLRLLVAPQTATVFSREPVRRLGVVSYSFYLSHGLAINAIAAICAIRPIDRILHPLGPIGYVALFLPVFGAATLAAFTLFRCVEQPLSLRVR